ncbi:hypothetical protein FHR25_005223 [Yokenella regensburgei]|nr:hypothetical protein FHR25_005223 [Yokenella regensburgei]
MFAFIYRHIDLKVSAPSLLWLLVKYLYQVFIQR